MFAALYLASALLTRGILPELRRHNPFRLLRHPILESAAASTMNPMAAAPVRWFEATTLIVNRLQAFLIAPAVVLCMIAQSADTLAARPWSPW